MVPKREHIIELLEKDPKRAYCNDCLIRALGLSPLDVTMSTANLADPGDKRVEAGYGWCSDCRRRDFIVRSRPSAA